MKAISIRQPWAWAIIRGKPVENRTYPRHYRGPLLIHASKTFDHEGYRWLLLNYARITGRLNREIPKISRAKQWGPIDLSAYRVGGIIGKVNMIDCVQSYESPWFFGPYGFVFKNPEPLPFYPCRGRLGLFEVDYVIE